MSSTALLNLNAPRTPELKPSDIMSLSDIMSPKKPIHKNSKADLNHCPSPPPQQRPNSSRPNSHHLTTGHANNFSMNSDNSNNDEVFNNSLNPRHQNNLNNENVVVNDSNTPPPDVAANDKASASFRQSPISRAGSMVPPGSDGASPTSPSMYSGSIKVNQPHHHVPHPPDREGSKNVDDRWLIRACLLPICPTCPAAWWAVDQGWSLVGYSLVGQMGN